MRRIVPAVMTTAVLGAGALGVAAPAQAAGLPNLGGLLGGGSSSGGTSSSGLGDLGGVLGGLGGILGGGSGGTGGTGLPDLGSLGGLLGTDAQCTGGLVSVTLGGTTICVAPDVQPVAGTTTCPDSLVAVNLAGQGVVCLSPDASPPVQVLPGVLPTLGDLPELPGIPDIEPPSGGSCRSGLLPIDLGNGSIGCILASLLGDAAGANGTNGTSGRNGTNGANGSSGGSGSSGSGSSSSSGGANGNNGSNGSGSVGAAGSSSTSTTVKKLVKPTLTLRSSFKRSASGVIRSATQKVTIVISGRKNGRLVKSTKTVTLRKTGTTAAARPYSVRVRVSPKAVGRVQIKLTSKSGSQKQTATYRRTVKR